MTKPTTEHMFELACKLYDTIAEDENTGWGHSDPPVFEGSMVAVYNKTRISRTYYTRLYSLLEELGSIVIERKGSRLTQSRIVLVQPPQREHFAQAQETLTRRLTRADSSAILRLEQRIEQIERRLQGIDVKDAIINLDQRLKRLETGENGET